MGIKRDAVTAMDPKLIKYVVCAITIAMCNMIISILHERPVTISGETGKTDYIVKPPSALKSVYMLLSFTGLFLFSFFLFLYIIGNKSATIGHLRTFLAFAAIGMAVTLYASKSRVCVSGERMELHRLLCVPYTVTFSEIERAEVKKKGQIYVYAGGRKIFTVDQMSESYIDFYHALDERGLIVQKGR